MRVYRSLQKLTKDSNCSRSFCWSNFICHCTFVHWSIIFSHQLCQIKSPCCRQFAVVSLFGPCYVRLWITTGITEQDGSIAFNNLISWWSWVNWRGNCKTKTEVTQLELLHGVTCTCSSIGWNFVLIGFKQGPTNENLRWTTTWNWSLIYRFRQG